MNIHEAEQQAKERDYTKGMAEAGCIGNAKQQKAACDYDYRPTLRDRLRMQISAGAEEGRKATLAGELDLLLETNPKVARILHLMDCLHINR